MKKIAFFGSALFLLAAGTALSPAARRVFAYAPTAYCTDEVTLNVWAPAGSEAVTFHGFTQSDNYATWNAAAVPATITRDGWTELKVTVPTNVGPGGLQRVGVQFLNADAAYTGDFYIDGVSWYAAAGATRSARAVAGRRLVRLRSKPCAAP